MQNKKVLVYRSDYLPISETFISDHLRSLRRYRPIVVCQKDTPAAHRIAVTPRVMGQGRIARKLFSYLGRSSEFERAISEEKPDLLHAHFLTDAAYILPFMERMKIPFVVTAHGYDAAMDDASLSRFPEGKLLVKRSAKLMRRVDRVICVSEFIKQELLRKGYPAQKLVVSHLGVDFSSLEPRSISSEDALGILFVGRLVEKKGTKYLIEAYARLPEALRACHPLRIIGDGPLRQELEALAKKLDVFPEFLGGQPRTIVVEHLKKAALFVLPSVRAANGDAEGMPIAIMEALATRVPVCIFSDQPMAPMLQERAAGLLPSPRDVAGLASDMERILSSHTLANRTAEAGRQLAVEKFDLFANTQRLEAIYDEVCAESGKGLPKQ